MVCVRGVMPLSAGVSNRKGVFRPRAEFWVASDAALSVITGARIRVMVWAVGLAVLAAVKPEEI